MNLEHFVLRNQAENVSNNYSYRNRRNTSLFILILCLTLEIGMLFTSPFILNDINRIYFEKNCILHFCTNILCTKNKLFGHNLTKKPNKQ